MPAPKRSCSRPATARASRVLPTPPGPVSVTSRPPRPHRQHASHLGDGLLPPDQRGAVHRQRPGATLTLPARCGPGPRAGREPLAQQHRQVVPDQLPQLGGIREVLIRDAAFVPDPVEQLRQPRLTVRRRRLDVDEPGQPGGQLVLVLQPGDLPARRDPAGALPVNAHEHLALRQVGPVHIPRRVRPRPDLGHHRHQPQSGDRIPHRLPLGGQFVQRGTHEHPQALVRRPDHPATRHALTHLRPFPHAHHASLRPAGSTEQSRPAGSAGIQDRATTGNTTEAP